jgi:hypothetical protein
MEWAITEEGKTGQGSILVILDERQVADGMAREMRLRGHRVDVRPYEEPGRSRPWHWRSGVPMSGSPE